MARTDIARVVARAVLEGTLEPIQREPGAMVQPTEAVDALLKGALHVKRRRMQNVGEVVELIYVVPPDPTTPED